MQEQNDLLELHYYFDDESHIIDAFVRNNCERELLAIAKELLTLFGEDEFELVTEPPAEGGFRDKWKLIKKNSTQITLSIMAAGILLQAINTYLSRTPVVHPEQVKGWELDNDIKRLTIQKLKKELEKDTVDREKVVKEMVDFIDTSITALKRKSNFYQTLKAYEKVERISTTTFEGEKVTSTSTVEKSAFSKYILKTNELPATTLDDAIIEIEAPVISNNNRMKWRGSYDGRAISFSMNDKKFKKDVQEGRINLHAAYFVSCVLTVGKRISDTGIVEETDFTVTTVLGEVKDRKIILTEQGKKYKRIKAQLANQTKAEFPDDQSHE